VRSGSYLSIKPDYPAEALGIRTGVTTRARVLSGIHGGGLAAPWNLIVQLWLAAWIAGGPGWKGRWGRAWLAFLSSLFVAGQVAEPVTHWIVTHELPGPDSAVAIANIAVPMVMLGGALMSLVDGSVSREDQRPG
jgi:hypothetical protein